MTNLNLTSCSRNPNMPLLGNSECQQNDSPLSIPKSQPQPNDYDVINAVMTQIENSEYKPHTIWVNCETLFDYFMSIHAFKQARRIKTARTNQTLRSISRWRLSK